MSREKLELVVEILRSRAKFLEAAYYLETAKSLIHAAELVQQCMDEVTTLSEEKKERIRNAISVGNLYPEWLVTRIEEIITEPPKDIVLEVQNGKLGHRSTLD